MAQITLRYFAAAADAAGREEEAWVPAAAPTLDALREHLRRRYGTDMDRVLQSGSFLVDGVVRCDGGAIAAESAGGPEAEHDAGHGTAGEATAEPVVIDVLPAFAGG